MADASDAVDVLTKKLRARLGQPDPNKVSDSDLLEFLDDALDELNQDRPATARSSITTVANQSGYDLPAAALDAYRVIKVYYQQLRPFTKFSDEVIFSQHNIRGIDIGHGANLQDNPAVAEQFFKDRTAFEDNFRGAGFQWNPDNGQITLYPTPGSAGEVVFFDYTRPRFATLAAVTKDMQKWILLLAEIRALGMMAMQESEIVAGTSVGGTFTTGGGRLKEARVLRLQEQYEAQFRNVPIGPSYGR